MDLRSAMKRRLPLLVVSLLGLYLAAEAAAWLALSISSPHGFSRAELDRERGAAIADAPGAADAAEGQKFEGHLRTEVLHPYLGFVPNPELGAAPDRIHPTDHYGFFNYIRPLPRRAPDRLNVAILGGSVAAQLGHEDAQLVASLQAVPAFAGKHIEVSNLALGGYKQPQQLMTLAWFLALGAEFVIIVCLDGFNDIALHPLENQPSHVSPLYPRGWNFRTATVVDPTRLEAIGEIVFLRRQRAELAAAYARAPWRWSPLANLRWRSRDRALAGRLFEARRSLQPPAQDSYQSTGPTVKYENDAQMFEDLSRIWARCSLQLDRLVRANGGRYYHFLQPNQYVPNSKQMGAAERARAWEEHHPYRPLVEKGYPLLTQRGEELRKQGVRFQDLTMLFAGHQEPLYGDTCCHVGRDGNRLLRAAIVEAIARDVESK
jgi:hypothetical protein